MAKTFCYAQAHVATVTKFQNNTNTVITQPFSTSSTSGNLIVVSLSYDNQARSITAVADTKGNTYTRVNGPTNWNGTSYRSELWYSYDIIGGGTAISVSATLSGAPSSFSQIYMSEYSGIQKTADPLDQHVGTIGNTAIVSSASRTLTYSNELLYGISIGASGVISAGTGFNTRSTANQNIVEDKFTSSAGVNTVTFTCAAGNWVVDMASFRSLTSVLPVELESLEAKAISEKMVQLKWITASEKNNAYFTIERSADGLSFEDLHKVAGSGTSSQKHYYDYTDAQPLEKIAYYRLKQTDFDDSFNYSQVCWVDASTAGQQELIFYPDPASDEITVEGPDSELRDIRITNTTGQIFKVDVISLEGERASKVILNLTSLQAGVYYLQTATKTKLLVKY